MKQYTLAHRKDFSGLTLRTDAPRPAIQSPTEVLLKIKALSLNARDLQIANGSYPAPHDIPENLVPVSDAAGEVVECGSKVDLWKTGDKVCTVVFQGHDQDEDVQFHTMVRGLGGAINGIAQEYFVVDQSQLVAMPAHMTYEEGSTLTIAAATAWSSLYGHHPKLKAGDTVLCLGSGGVSLFAAQIALNAGAKVIITSSSDNKITQVQKLLEPLVRPGSPEDVLQAINYNTTPDWDKEVAKLTGGRKVDIVIEISGRATLGKSIRSTRSGGLVAISGYLSDYSDLDPKIKEEDLAKTLLYSAVNARGNFVGNKQQFMDMNRAFEIGGVRPVVDKVFEFEQLREAYDYLQSAKHIGKVVVKVST
ncbi:hypothetical protein QFC24_004900 [Naganishia onofrii]|uniref:Uncharacterized protein n=1 Tax=Naganishia onofrii TaxID=1851511 RepID=A0ACC2XB23_9TREE|nr:hypothetical protein QFC24_004900 [Naganishia onofrii]